MTFKKLNSNEILNFCFLKLKAVISPALILTIKDYRYKFAEFLDNARFWQWKSMRFVLNVSDSTNADLTSNPTQVHYIGSADKKPILMALLGVPAHANDATSLQATNQESVNQNSGKQVFITDLPMPGAIRIPSCLITLVKLNRPIEDILATYSRSLRRSINAQRAQYRYEAVSNVEQMEVLENEMFRPYATARHDLGAAQLEPGIIKKLAKPEYGRLDILYQGSEAVGAHIGNHYQRDGKRYWHVNRLGYPANIFSDYKRWGDVNAMNLHLALESAIANNYDFCDYGMSLARPGAGLIEWKRRRKGFLSNHGIYQHFYLKLPKTGAAQFLWDAPVFAVEKDKIALYLGIPAGKTDEEVKARYHEMGYGGLHKVYLQVNQMPSEDLVLSLQTLYVDQDTQPEIVTALVD